MKRIVKQSLILAAAALFGVGAWSRAAAEEAEMFADVVDVFVEAVGNVGGARLADVQVQQFRAQFDPLLKVELSLAIRTCKPTDEQRTALIRNSNKWLETFIRDYAKKGGQPNANGAWFGPMAANLPNPRDSIELGVMEAVRAELSKEQAKLYEEECSKRAAFHKRVAVENLVAKIDGKLMLTPEQRETLTESFGKNWQKSWAPQLEMFMYGGEMWPNVPDQFIRPHLTAAQQAVWSRLTKQTGNMFFGGHLFGIDGNVIDDVDLEEAEKKVADGDKKAAAAGGAYQPAEPVAER